MMTDVEDRLRRDLTTFAERVTAGNIRGPQPPSGQRPARRAWRWLAPAGAAMAVAGVITAAGLIAAAGHRVHIGATGPVAPASAPAPGMPRFYVVVYNTFAGEKIPTIAAVHDSATGKTLAKVQVPTLYSGGGADGPGISAAADDRTYVVTQQGGSGAGGSLAKFYLLRVAANGRSATVKQLPISWPRSLSPDVAHISPDGTRLAIAVQDCYQKGCYYSGVRVITIATGAVRTWTTTANGAPFQLSWAGNSQVAFEWQSSSKTPPAPLRTAYRLLDVRGRGGNLLSGPIIATPKPVATGAMPAALVTADGSRVVTTEVTSTPDGHGTDTVVARVVELAARTGRLLRVLATTRVTGAPTNENSPNSAGSLEQGCNVLSLAPSGTNVLLGCFSFGRIGIHGFTPLPGSPAPVNGGVYAW
jgi:hypothetical protein